ncbi:MAG: hypothetical protein LWX51_15790 [Deltaproteobacteria bacterium]|jgi:hypothetical protein|nr:hypothetical protein [Deltaproteobacteria bacterium]
MKDFSLEWSRTHKHKDGTIGRDTTLRDGLGRPKANVEAESFKTETEDIQLPEGQITLERLKDGTVLGGSFSGGSGGGSGGGY